MIRRHDKRVKFEPFQLSEDVIFELRTTFIHMVPIYFYFFISSLYFKKSERESSQYRSSKLFYI